MMRGKKGLSQVVTTMIVLVVAVLLAVVVTYYATNVTMVRTEREELHLGKAQVWVNSTDAVAAFKLQNIGSRDVLLDKLTVRNIEEGWGKVYYYRVPSGFSFIGDMNLTGYDSLTGNNVTIDGRTYVQSSDDLPLKSGAELLILIKGPDNIQIDDIGGIVNIIVFTENANYLTETRIKSATLQGG
ncbi:MAG: hypothetical protein OEZ31_08355 [Nitrospirota bacterium]|nr:hypothetical protein [Nitrospirota bacterium]